MMDGSIIGSAEGSDPSSVAVRTGPVQPEDSSFEPRRDCQILKEVKYEMGRHTN